MRRNNLEDCSDHPYVPFEEAAIVSSGGFANHKGEDLLTMVGRITGGTFTWGVPHPGRRYCLWNACYHELPIN